MSKKKKLMGCIITIFAVLVIAMISYFAITNIDKNNSNEEIKVGQQYTPKKENIRTDEVTGIKYINNEIMIMFNTGVSKEKKEEINNNINGKIVGIIDKEWDWIQVEVSERSYNELEELIKELEKKEEVFGAILDLVGKFTNNATSTNDPSDEKEWKKRNLKSANWWLKAIQANEAWDYNDRFNNIKIGIVDSGFDTGHEDLNIKFARKSNEDANNKDDHGTHVAGIIGATANNGKGVAGIVWNKELICYDWQPSWLQEKLGGWDTKQATLAGLSYTVKSGAKVVNFSLGTETEPLENGNNFSQQGIDKLADYFSKGMVYLLSEGYDFVVVQSSGNGDKNKFGVDAKNNCCFAGITSENCYTNSEVSADDILNRIIVVANVEQTDNGYQIYKSSNCGNAVDICAPGQNIYSTITGEFLNVTQLKGSYGYKSGTSMAAPMVTGVASLVWSVNEEFTGEEVKEIVCNNYSEWVRINPESKYTTSPYSDENGYLGYPMVNAKLAVEEAIRRTDTLVVPIEDETNPSEPVEIEEIKNYEWHLAPTIEADNMIVPDYDGELFEKYAIIEKGGKYGLISNKGKNEVECKHSGYAICSIDNTYIMANKIDKINDYICESDDYTLENNKLVKSQHGGHGGDWVNYAYDQTAKEVLGLSLGTSEKYTGKEVVPAELGINKNEDGWFEEYGKWGLVSGNGIVKDFIYTNGRYTDNLVALEENNLWGYFDRNGKEIIPFIAERSSYINSEEWISSTLPYDNMAFMDVDGILAVNTKDGGCFYDIKGNQLTNPDEFEEVRPMINGFAWVKKDGKWGVIRLKAFEKNDDDWKKVYTDYIKSVVERDSNIYENGKFIFIDIDSNDIPEIFYDSGSGAGGSGVIIYNGNAKELHMGNSSGIIYIKGKNLFNYSGGHMGNYYDKLYCIDNGEFVLLDNGEYYEINNTNIQSSYDYEYYWNDIQVSKEEYDNSLNNAFDVKKAINPFDDTMYNYEEFLEAIKNYNISENSFNSNAELTTDIILKSINNYLSSNWNGENKYKIIDVFEHDDYYYADIYWDGASQPNTMSGNTCRVYKNDGTAEIYFFDDEDNILASFNVFDYNEDNVKSTENSKKETGTVKIDDGYLNIRESPSKNGKIIGKLYNGDKVTIEETSEDGKWLKISKSDIKGYVSSDYISKNLKKEKITMEDFRKGVNCFISKNWKSNIYYKIPQSFCYEENDCFYGEIRTEDNNSPVAGWCEVNKNTGVGKISMLDGTEATFNINDYL